MEFRWEALTLRGSGGRVELRLVRTAGAVEVAMVPYANAEEARYVVEVRRERSGRWRTVRTVGSTDDYSTGLAMVVDAVLEVEHGSRVCGA
ncbi:hypothetical protein [Halomarina rubra]|uniref:Uncharacterized protein n=1 Tax=Halomarina rubra TaxID=2071873 RepID=A0ABD6AYW0_9EURY|nr:hypothetical protein [Halomarina rubra]